jgi:hypothetical protein
LPESSKNQGRLLFDERLGIDSWELDVDSLTRIDGKVEIILYLIDIHVFLGI